MYATLIPCGILVLSSGPLGAVADPTRHWEMFLDDVSIASSTGIQRQLQQPNRSSTPVLTGMGRWDASPNYGSVLYDRDEQIYKAWYNANGAGNPVCYATSVDGRTWNYPSLGLETSSYKDEIYDETNILFYGERYEFTNSTFRLYGASVIKDDADPVPSRRYKMIYTDMSTDGNGNGIEAELYRTRVQDAHGDAGIFTATSPDGIHWTRSSAPTQPQLYFKKQNASVSDAAELVYDAQKGKYVIYSKSWDWRDRAGQPLNPTPDHRLITRTESSDFIHWSEPEVVVRHDNTLLDPQSYGASVFEYEGMYLMTLRSYQDTGVADGHRGDPAQIIDVKLAASRDGIHWTRVADNATFMPVGAYGTFDDGMVMPFNPLVGPTGDIEIFYQGWDGPHDYVEGVSPPKRVSAVGLATLDAGRFVAVVAADGDEASVTTTTFVMDGESLLLNAELGETGGITVDVLSYKTGEPLPQFTAAISELTAVNDLYFAVSWSTADLAILADKSAALRFTITGDAKLYGYTTAVVPEPAMCLGLLAAFGVAAQRGNASNRL